MNFLDQLRSATPQVVISPRATDEQSVNAAEGLEQTIQQAAYQTGGLDAEDVEWLAVLSQQKALKCPENDVHASGIVWSYELLPGPQNGVKDTCPCCGKSAWWWDRYGNRKCGVGSVKWCV